jgi:hypothetical protein
MNLHKDWFFTFIYYIYVFYTWQWIVGPEQNIRRNAWKQIRSGDMNMSSCFLCLPEIYLVYGKFSLPCTAERRPLFYKI